MQNGEACSFQLSLKALRIRNTEGRKSKSMTQLKSSGTESMNPHVALPFALFGSSADWTKLIHTEKWKKKTIIIQCSTRYLGILLLSEVDT
jgi:hypothetical protein